jgi:nucleotide-binding universal stress UspA family protein
VQLLACREPGSRIGGRAGPVTVNAGSVTRHQTGDPVNRRPGAGHARRRRYPRPVTTVTPPATDLRLIVGFDGSPPASRAVDAAVNLLQGRTGAIHVVYVAHMPSMATLSPGAVSELEQDFDDVERELRAVAGERLRGREERWDFERRQGLIAEELLAAAKETGSAHPDATVVIVVGSSSQLAHRMVGSVAVSLARHSPVPLVVVP